MLSAYRENAAERLALGIPPLALNATQTKALTELLETPPSGEEQELLHLLSERIPPGVDEAAYVKATWLSAIAQGQTSSPLVSPLEATRLLATMVGGYNVAALIELLQHNDVELAGCAAEGLSRTLLVYDAFNEVMELATSNRFAKQVVDSWAAAEWFTAKPELAESITVTVFKVEGETNTDDLSPATHATTRPDIPIHALAMLETRDPEGLKTIAGLFHPDAGSIRIRGHEMTGLSGRERDEVARLGMLFQRSALFDSLTVWENITFRLRQNRRMPKEEAIHLAQAKLGAVGLAKDTAQLYPVELSGGMQKRVGIARALADEPEILLLDEPTAGLDPIMTNVINDLILENVRELGATVVTVTSNLDGARHIADRIIMMNEGRAVWEGIPDDLAHSGNPYVDQFVHKTADGPIGVGLA